MVLLAVRGLDRIEQLEQQLAAMTAGSGEPAKRAALDSHSVRSSTIPADPQIAPVIVGGVDVAPLATAANIVGLVESAPSDEGATEGAALRASLRMARVLVQETFEELQAAQPHGVRHEGQWQGSHAATTRSARSAGAAT